MIIDDDIWESVKLHPWKARPRYDGPITLVELHATRSGIEGRTPMQEYGSTINWFKSQNNINEALTRPWASMASYIVGNGRICRVMPDHYWPSFSLGHADPFAISIEIAQATKDTPFDPRDLESAAQICAEISTLHNIPARVLPYLSLDNHQAPGYVRHDRSDNGQWYGKSDPGWLFNDAAFEDRVKAIIILSTLPPAIPIVEENDMVKLFATGNPYQVWAVMPSTAKAGGAVRRWVQNGMLLSARQILGVWPDTVTFLTTGSSKYALLMAIPEGVPIT